MNDAGLAEKIKAILNIYKTPQVNKTMKKRGLLIKVKEDQPMAIGETKVVSSHIKARMPRTSKLLRPLRPQLKELYDAHLWLHETVGVVGFSDSWKVTFENFVSHSANSVVDQSNYLYQAYQAGLGTPLLFLYLDPIMVIKALKRGRSGSMLLPLQMMFSSAKSAEGLSLSVATAEQGINARLAIPHSLLSAVKNGMSGGSSDEVDTNLETNIELR